MVLPGCMDLGRAAGVSVVGAAPSDSSNTLTAPVG
jgi:hypothetical protein